MGHGGPFGKQVFPDIRLQRSDTHAKTRHSLFDKPCRIVQVSDNRSRGVFHTDSWALWGAPVTPIARLPTCHGRRCARRGHPRPWAPAPARGLRCATASATTHRISNRRLAPVRAVWPVGSSGGDTSHTSPPGSYRIAGSSWVNFSVTACFYRLSSWVVANAASLEKAISYQALQSCTRCVRLRNPP